MSSIAFILSSIISLLLLSNSLIHCDGNECKENLPRAEVNEAWFLQTSRSNPDAWHVAMMDPVSDSEIYGIMSNSKPMPSNGSKEICVTVYPRPGEGGVAALVDKVGLKCIYEQINLQYCEAIGNSPILSTLPKNARLEAVKTDGQNYVAVVVCIAGVLQKWLVLTPTQEPLPNDTIYEIMSYLEQIGVASKNTESNGHYAERVSVGGECTNNDDGFLGALSSIFG